MDKIELAALSDPCVSGDCPTIYCSPDQADDSLYVQGYKVDVSGTDRQLPDGEGIVRINNAVLLQAARALGYTVIQQ